MPLESATYINSLVSTNPTSPDQVGQGDDHIRLIKAVLLSSFPNISGAVTLTHTQINTLNTDVATILANYVKKDGTVAFTGEVAGITPTLAASLTRKDYVDAKETTLNAAIALKADKTTTVTGGTSLAGGGDLSANRILTLLNDAASPGNSKYYGTDSGGTKGWFSLPTETWQENFTTAQVALSNLIPYDGTDPLVTEGHEFASIASVVVAAGQKVEIEVDANVWAGDDIFTVALFRGSTCIAARMGSAYSSADECECLFFRFLDDPGAGTYTYSVRAGCVTFGSRFMNARDGSGNPAFTSGSMKSGLRLKVK